MDGIQYEVKIAPIVMKQINRISDYILEDLCAEKAAKSFTKQVKNEIEKLQYTPEMYAEIEKYDELNRRYRRIIIKNFIILYTVDEMNLIVYISKIYYGQRNYL